MDTIIKQMLKSYRSDTLYDKKNAMKEVMQEIVLCGLSRSGFFRDAAFYGGTALRIFHGLDRFSEDLDFSLIARDENFDIDHYFPTLAKEVQAYGLNVSITRKEKNQDSQIQSAFLKGNTKEHMLAFYPGETAGANIATNEMIRIKFEVDINPPDYATYEYQYRLLPVPYEVRLYDIPSLFAGKIHAILCRGWQQRVKGRDLYDYIFYLARGADVNEKHLEARLIQTGYTLEEGSLTMEGIKSLLSERFDSINYKQARSDVEPFIRDTSVLDVWSADFFKQITAKL